MFKFLYFFLIILTTRFLPATETIEYQNETSRPVVILGSGVAALTSAIYLQRAGIDTLIIEGNAPGGAIAQSPLVHNWPGEMKISGRDLIERIRQQAIENGAKIVSEEVVDVDFSKPDFKIYTCNLLDPSKTHIQTTKACIIAMGSKPKLLGVRGESGENGYWTRGVYSCAVCDGPLYKDKTVAVIGGGDSAIIEANYLSKIAKKVYVIIRSDHFRTVETVRKNELIKKPNVEVLYNTKINEIQGDGKKVTHLNLSTSKQISIDGVFVAIGATPNSSIFKDKLALDEQGYILLTNGQQTSIPGVFAIGDIIDPIYKQAISAAGDGAKASMEVENYLSSQSESRICPQTPLTQINYSQKGQIEDITSKEEFYEAIGNKQPVVFDFYSPYCGPCKQLSPQLEEISKKHQGKIRFFKVDVTQFSELANNYNIYSVPTVLIFDTQGKMVGEGTGLEEIIPMLKNLEEITSR